MMRELGKMQGSRLYVGFVHIDALLEYLNTKVDGIIANEPSSRQLAVRTEPREPDRRVHVLVRLLKVQFRRVRVQRALDVRTAGRHVEQRDLDRVGERKLQNLVIVALHDDNVERHVLGCLPAAALRAEDNFGGVLVAEGRGVEGRCVELSVDSLGEAHCEAVQLPCVVAVIVGTLRDLDLLPDFVRLLTVQIFELSQTVHLQ